MLDLIVMIVILLGEEIGWRGFMLPRVQELTDPATCGGAHRLRPRLFHLPLILIATTYDTEGRAGSSHRSPSSRSRRRGVFYAWLKDRSGSVWPATIGHTLANTTFDWGFAALVTTTPASLAYVAGETGVATLAGVVVLAGVLLANAKVWKPIPVDLVTGGAGATRDRAVAH